MALTNHQTISQLLKSRPDVRSTVQIDMPLLSLSIELLAVEIPATEDKSGPWTKAVEKQGLFILFHSVIFSILFCLFCLFELLVYIVCLYFIYVLSFTSTDLRNLHLFYVYFTSILTSTYLPWLTSWSLQIQIYFILSILFQHFVYIVISISYISLHLRSTVLYMYLSILTSTYSVCFTSFP